MDKRYLDKMVEAIKANSIIPSELYSEYNVKRGLRNSNGTGVLVGLTKVGDVHGYLLDEGEQIADHGRLRYRGISVANIVTGFQDHKRYGFEETCYLLLFGKLPNRQEYDEFTKVLAEYRELPDNFIEEVILKFPSANIMNMLSRCILVLYSFDDKADDTSVANVLRQSIKLIAQLPQIAAYSYMAYNHYYKNASLVIHRPDASLSHAENFLHVLRPDSNYTQLEAEILDLCMVLHAEHGGGNNSSFTTHVVSSSGTDTFSSMAASVGSLKGPLHGGANIRVKGMIDDLKATVSNINSETEVEDYLSKLIKREAYDKSGLIYGIGHAVYTASDPRAVLLMEKAGSLAKASGNEEEFELYKRVARLGPEVFRNVKNTDKIISANVDLFSGLVYQMLNIPQELYTPIFAVSRSAGWSAHRIEELVFNPRIMRPAYKNVFPRKTFIPIEDRQ